MTTSLTTGVPTSTTGSTSSFSMLRLALASATSGIVLGALASGPWSTSPLCWPAGVLWATPLLIAARCFPLAISIVLAIAIACTGRMLGLLWGGAGVESAMASALFMLPLLLAPAFVIDRVVHERWPRMAVFVWPVLCFHAAWRVDVRQFPIPHVASMHSVVDLHASIGPALAVFLTALFAQAFASVGSLHHRKRSANVDLIPTPLRDRGATISMVVAFVAAIVLVLSHALFAS